MKKSTGTYFIFLLALSLSAGCYVTPQPGPDPDEDPVLFGCKNNAVAKSSTLKITGQSIIAQMKPARFVGYDYMWEHVTYGACPDGNISGSYLLEIEGGADSFMTVQMYRHVYNETAYEENFYTPQLISIAGLDISGFDAKFNYEKVCIGCQPEATFECHMMILVKINPIVGDKTNFIANNVTEVYMNLNHTGY